MAQKAKGGKKNRKVGRDKARCTTYMLARRREHNKVRRLNRHLRYHPMDLVAARAKDNAQVVIRG